MSMSGDANDNFNNWDERRLGKFFRSHGLGEYEATLIKHKITGRLAPLLTDADLKDMGINVVGDRLQFKLCLKELQRSARFHKRIETLWEGQEKLFFSGCEKSCFTLGGLFPVDPGSYVLTRNHLRVKHVKPIRCFCILLPCFGMAHTSNNIDLSKVDDVDVTGIPAPCCERMFCSARGIDKLEVER